VPEPVPVVHLGPEELSGLVDASPELRLGVPAVLGVRDADLPPEAAERSTADLAAATELARVFVATRAYQRAVDVLQTHHFAVLTGPPEMGKTAIARTIALAQLTAGWEAHECIRPEQLWAAFARDRPQVFVADDAFGSTEYRPEAAERWAVELDRALRAMDDRHWLIWTSRPAPLKSGLRRIHREHGIERFPQPAHVQVDAAALGVDEKALILFRHAKAAGLPGPAAALVREHGWRIVSHEHFTPERIRRFVGGRLPELAAQRSRGEDVHDAVAEEIREPTTAMAASFAALAPEHRAVLVAMLDAPPGPVAERDLAASARRHSDTGFARTPTELIDRLGDHFLRLVPPASVAWVHPSWRDLVIAQLAADGGERRGFLERCELEGILLALSVAGGAAGERVLPLLRDDADWDIAATRIALLSRELDQHATIRLLGSLAATLDAELAGNDLTEAEALARLALERVSAAWDARQVPIGVAALEAWLSLAARLEDPPPAPRFAPTWIELLPSSTVDAGSREEVARFDEWLTLAAVLHELAPRELDRFGFPEAQRAVLAAFVAEAASHTPEGSEELVVRVLRRLRRLVPSLSAAAEDATYWLNTPDDRWFEVRFETHTRAPEPAPSDEALVARVLRDLD
jgi:hypothetical protein